MYETCQHCVLQEMASRGLSAVYQLGDEHGRSELLNSLMGTLQGQGHYSCQTNSRVHRLLKSAPEQ